VGGVEFFSHQAKAVVLFDFYSNLLGSVVTTTWHFILYELYPQLDVATHPLSKPFSPDETCDALFAIDRNASPGPNGFGPSFYRAFSVKLRGWVTKLFDDFYSGNIDLDGLNKAHLILIPKREDVRTPDSYRPISLQKKLTDEAFHKSHGQQTETCHPSHC
jgi:hypothetical protein